MFVLCYLCTSFLPPTLPIRSIYTLTFTHSLAHLPTRGGKKCTHAQPLALYTHTHSLTHSPPSPLPPYSLPRTPSMITFTTSPHPQPVTHNKKHGKHTQHTAHFLLVFVWDMGREGVSNGEKEWRVGVPFDVIQTTPIPPPQLPSTPLTPPSPPPPFPTPPHIAAGVN